MAEKISVCIVGSGNWGSAIAKIIGANCARLPEFEERVTMFVYEEIIDGKKLTDIINTSHENIKYLPGHQLPTNVVEQAAICRYRADDESSGGSNILKGEG